MKKSLVGEDEVAIREFEVINLKRVGYDTVEAGNGEDALRLYEEQKDFDIALLDISMPGMDGLTLCRELRSRSPSLGIIMLTAREDETDKVFGLEIGADDYITKPFSIRELMARVKANIRRSAAAAPAAQPEKNENVLQVKDLTIDMDRHAVYRDGKEIDLTEREYNILQLMAAEPGKIFSREELMRQVWQYDYFGDLRTVDVAMRRFREKLEKKPAEPEYIMTRRGAGYYFAD